MVRRVVRPKILCQILFDINNGDQSILNEIIGRIESNHNLSEVVVEIKNSSHEIVQLDYRDLRSLIPQINSDIVNFYSRMIETASKRNWILSGYFYHQRMCKGFKSWWKKIEKLKYFD